MSDTTISASRIFIDSLGTSLPFKQSFTYKELNDFCRREGLHVLAEKDTLSDEELMEISHLVHEGTGGKVSIHAEPLNVEGASRSPLSVVDLSIVQKNGVNRVCKRCGENSGPKTFCNVCYTVAHRNMKLEHQAKLPIGLYAHVTLKNGERVHVVEMNGNNYVGVDDEFMVRHFKGADVKAYTNLEEELDTALMIRCGMCGEESSANKDFCANCSYTWWDNNAT